MCFVGKMRRGEGIFKGTGINCLNSFGKCLFLLNYSKAARRFADAKIKIK